ncbi:hypothetical protein A7L45_11105 [Clostridium estertheticum subsp. estertheticum]|uniref:Core-binding (CB) domain-containing protein n=1 Tax=Clostridium estertheticum subsp. estertheticum TaxID=1552 RepID=A0A1J0GGZ1_9CLOT|nr:hypothetical protein A7L45_11105 [Clostridium estertheticum subsp. estertheticum]
MFQARNISSFSDVKKLKGVKVMSEIIENLELSIIEDGKSPKTIESYVGDIKTFIDFLSRKAVEFNGI